MRYITYSGRRRTADFTGMNGDDATSTDATLKSRFGVEVPRRIAGMIGAVHPAFPEQTFLREALAGYEDLELTPRARQISRALASSLPGDYPEAVAILVASIGPVLEESDLTGMGSFLYLPHVFFVAEHGTGHWEESMRAQYELTQRFTAEFSIRAFLVSEPERTLARLRDWATDSSTHVRRLVSEGTRPRLPWAPRLRAFQQDPGPVLELLELLRDDPELYVRRSVANNLNDIAKDHPETAIATCARWMRDATPERVWLVRHALRSVLKQGRSDALAVLGYGSGDAFSVGDLTIAPEEPQIGDSVRITFTVQNGGPPATAMIDLRVHFVKSRGTATPKVFKVAVREMGSGERTMVAKSVSLAQHTTRTHHPGVHEVDVMVNGTIHRVGRFLLASRRISPAGSASRPIAQGAPNVQNPVSRGRGGDDKGA